MPSRTGALIIVSLAGLAGPSVLALLTVLTTASAASAETHIVAAAGGGLPALDVHVDLATGAVDANGARVAIEIDHAQLPAEGAVIVEDVAIGQGRHVVHVRVPLRDAAEGGPAWEALFAAGHAKPIFAGMTGPVDGDPGERTGKAIQIIRGAGGAAGASGTASASPSFVLVGTTHEGLQICGQASTLFDPQALYPASLDLRPATVQRLTLAQQAAAEKLVATEEASATLVHPPTAASSAQSESSARASASPSPSPATSRSTSLPLPPPPAAKPLAQLLVSRASSVPDSRGAELTDGSAETAWREQRPGVGQGEFVVMAAPRGLPITRLALQVTPSAPPRVPNAAAPKTLYVVTSGTTFEVTLPTDGWSHPGATYDVVFPEPVESSCLALVLDTAYSRGSAHPDVGLAEVIAYSEFDAVGATLDDVAHRLSSERGFAAAQLLERAGAPALAAVANAYDALDPRGRALAIDVAASHDPCDEAAPLLARGLCEPGGEAPRKAREKLERCKGAAPALARRLVDEPGSRVCLAPTLATIAPDAALEPIADALALTPEADVRARAALRAAFARALGAAGTARLPALLGDPHRSAAVRLELMRAAERGIVDARAESEATLNELLAGTPPLRLRYLVLEPLAALAHAGDPIAAGRLMEAIGHDPDWPVRAHASEIAGSAALQALLGAARDPEPRVREAALGALAAAPSPEAVRLGTDALANDGWPFVKAEAVTLLANASPSKDADNALGEALRDSSVRVRGAAIVALARRRAVSWRGAIRERLDDAGEDVEVRSSAARALGALCDADATDRLTELAGALANPATEEDAQALGLGALLGLAALHPVDLGKRVGPLLDKSAPPYAQAAAQQALAARPLCK